jgi:hypothetical protein
MFVLPSEKKSLVATGWESVRPPCALTDYCVDEKFFYIKVNVKTTEAGREKLFACQEFNLLHPVLASHFRG